jgi:uncharacterized membrane protein
VARRWVGPLVLVAALVFAAVVFPFLPARIPTHWNVHGQVDAWMSRWPGAFLMPAIGGALWLLLLGLRSIDPRRAHYERFKETFWVILNVLSIYFALFTVLSLGVALGWPIDMTRTALLSIAILFIVLGGYLPRIRSNWWIGIRTPWTLENEEVWRKTHRLGGRLFIIGGAVALVGALLPPPFQIWVALGGLLLAGLVPVVYSYFAFRSEK